MLESMTIMLVDDNALLRQALKRRLKGHGYRVVDYASGEEATAYVSQNLGTVSYVFIDHKLQTGIGRERRWDGIETTRTLMQVDPHLCIVVFSGQADISAADRRGAREVGARRYVYKQGGIEIERLVLDFIQEVEMLRELSRHAVEMREQRESLATTLREIRVGALLIDRDYFPWVVSTDWRRIEEQLDPLYPAHRFADFVCADVFRKRLLDNAFNGKESDELALCTMQSGVLKYLHVWARPIWNAQGDVIACSLSMVDQTTSDTVRHMSLRQRLRLIGQAIQRANYDRVRLYRASDDGECLVGVAEVGGGLHTPFESLEIPIARVEYVRTTIAARQPRFWPIEDTDNYVREALGVSSGRVIYPLFEQKRLLGMLAVDREVRHANLPLSDADIPLLMPYAQEVHKAFLEAPQGEEQPQPRGSNLAGVWADIDQCTNPQEAMERVLNAVRDLTGCTAAHIRVRQGNEAVKVAYYGDYSRHRDKTLPLDTIYWSVRVMHTGQPILVQDIGTMREEILTERETWTPEAKEAFAQAKAFAIFPLPYGTIVGALVVLAPQVQHFTEERRATLQALARLAATAWVDFNRAQERQNAALRDVAFATVHNLRQPTMALRGALQRILTRHTRGTLTLESAVEAAHDALTYLQRSESIITDVLRYLKPLALRQQVVTLRPLVQPIAAVYEEAQTSLRIVLNIPQEIAVYVDDESLRQVFEELFSNASKAMHHRGTIRVHASFVSPWDATKHPGQTVRLVVEDDGPGVPVEMVSKLFEPFVTGTAQGTGLGLAFVKRVIEEHGGPIQYEPVQPHGARFIFILPADSGEKLNG